MMKGCFCQFAVLLVQNLDMMFRYLALCALVVVELKFCPTLCLHGSFGKIPIMHTPKKRGESSGLLNPIKPVVIKKGSNLTVSLWYFDQSMSNTINSNLMELCQLVKNKGKM